MRSLLGRFHRPMSRGLVNNMLTMNNLGDGSTLSLDFTTMGGVLDPRLTFSRAGGGTYVGPDGYIYGVDSATSASLAIGTGSKSVTLTATAGVNRRFQVGEKVYFSSGANNMNGFVTAYSASTQVITINATDTTGSGSFTSWFVGNASPRFDYSPTNIGEPRGLLVEGNVTNFITQSQALSGYTPYSMIAISIDGTVTDPMGGAETKKVAASYSAGPVFHGWVTYLASQPASTTFTVSIFAKKNNYKYLFLCDVITNLAAVRFNLDTGVADLPVGSGGLGYVSSKMTPAGASGSGWYRCEMTATTPAAPPPTGTRGWCFVGVPDTGATYAVTGASYPGSVNSNDGIYAIGFQVEAGSRASSYIPTGASQVTRAVDTAIIAAGTNFSSWYTGGTTGTFVSNWYGSASSTTARSVIATSDVDDKHLHLYQTASALTLRLADYGALATVTTANNLTANALTKGAFSYAGTATSLCLKGGTVATGTLGFSVAPTFLSIGGPSTNGTSITDTTVMLNNSIRTLKYYPTRLTDAQIKDITT